jgi:two-component system response regulator AtoC
MYRYKLLIVDDDKQLQTSLRHLLRGKYDIIIAGSGEEALSLLDGGTFDLILLDIRLPGIDGIDTLRALRKKNKEVLVIMMTAYEDIRSVVTSMKNGAFDYLVKPLNSDELEIIIQRALNNLRLQKEVDELRKAYVREFDIDDVVGESEGIKRALQMADKIAKSPDTTVLIEGETGTGKEVIAQMVHYRSGRLGKPFISINCSAIGRDLVESELFGYEKGSFTGGLQEGKKGQFEAADHGTLFLDEVSELTPTIQAKLLRFLEIKEFYRVGGTEKKKVDVRVVAATNKKLETMISEGLFREDLYYRLNVAKIFLPPLRERKEDIMPLAYLFMQKFNTKFGKNFNAISREGHDLLLKHPWQGNVRELRNCIERILLMEEGQEIKREHLASVLVARETQPYQNIDAIQIPPSGIKLDELTKVLIRKAVDMKEGNKVHAAKLLGISRATLLYRIKKYGLKI